MQKLRKSEQKERSAFNEMAQKCSIIGAMLSEMGCVFKNTENKDEARKVIKNNYAEKLRDASQNFQRVVEAYLVALKKNTSSIETQNHA